jgi:hypothetical protein
MRRLVIRPFPTLEDVLGTLGDRVSTSRWSGRDISYCSQDDKDIPALERLAQGEAIAGPELLAALRSLAILIDGELRAAEATGAPWLVLRAVDSTWFEVLSADPAVHAAVRTRFTLAEESSNDDPAA